MGDPIEIVKSPADHREYRALELPNGLRAILIRDPQINASSGATPTGPGDHEVVDDADDGMTDGSDSDGSEGSEGSEGSNSGSEEGEEHEHVRPHRPHGALPGDGGVKKAAAALSVGIGHYSDPAHLQGLSHYLEHMLFMGSEKYPDENDYDSFLSAHSGASNACTEEEATTYHFDCAPGALEPALDRFAQFFVAPLVKADALEREVRAVDNEFSGVLQSDACRALQLRAHTAREGHPARKFGWGNRKSLVDDPAAAGTDVRAELLRHHREQYSAERMNLVVLGGEEMATLEGWVRQKFGDVAGGRGGRPRYAAAGLPYPSDGGPRLCLLPAVRDEHRLAAVFQLPCLEESYRKKAEEYVSHLVGHEGRGSLLAALKARGWATGLCAGVADQTSAAYIFEVSMTLTEAGLAAGPGCGLAAAGLLFQYLAMLRAAEPQRWAWEEMAAIADMKWRYLEEDDAAEYAAQVASDMHMYPLDHALEGPFIHEEFDPDLIRDLLARMTPAAARLDLQTRGFEACRAAAAALAGADAVVQGEEPWFKIPYAMATLPAALAEEWGAAEGWAADLALPPPNPYLPSDFELKCGEGDGKEGDGGAAAGSPFPSPPTLVADVPGLRVWHKLDAIFRVPRAAGFFRLTLSAGYATPAAAALTHLTVKLLEDALCQDAYLADVADLHYNLWFEGVGGVDVKVDGFSHRLPRLAALVFRTLGGLRFTDEDWARVHEALLRTYKNANMKPTKHASYLRLRALKGEVWPVEAVRDALAAATPGDSRAFLPELLREVHVEALVFGNTSEEEAGALGEAARAALGATAPSRPGDRCLRLPGPACSLLLRSSVVNPEEDNSALESYFQCGPAGGDARGRALLDFIDQIVYEPCYDTLRTKEQLGYTVSSGLRLTHGVNAMCFVVQSGTHGPTHLDARVDAFLAGFADRLASMDPAEFERNRQALLANKMMRDRNLAEAAERAWDAVANRGAAFTAKAEEVAAIKELTQAEVAGFFAATFAPGGAARRKLAVHVAGRAHAAEVTGELPAGVTAVEDVDALKAGGEFYPPVEAMK